MAPSVVYLGYRIDAQGLHPMPDKEKAVMDAPQPTTITELKSYLRLIDLLWQVPASYLYYFSYNLQFAQ